MNKHVSTQTDPISYLFPFTERVDSPIPIMMKTVQEWRAEKKTSSEENWLRLQGKRIEANSYFYIPTPEGQVEKVIVVWDPQSPDPRMWLWLAARLGQELPPGNYRLADHPRLDAGRREQFYLGWGLSAYQFRKYLKVDEKPKPCLVVPREARALTEELLSAIFMTRDLINTPALDMGPEDLAGVAQGLALAYGASYSLLQGEALLEANYPAVFHVGRGSERAPALVDLQWGNEHHPLICLVGKGVTFDSGGLNLKPERGMLLMKKDMGGAAIVLGLARLIMARKLPVRLRVLIPAVENMVSGNSLRPGDIIPTRKGLSVEITNTDAEGRLILCDALAEAVTDNPDLIIDVATLTGACRVALGEDLPGFFTKSDELAEQLLRASQAAADPIWRLPLWASYRPALQSLVADLNNSPASGFAGAIHAALFLSEFLGDFKNWVHLDAYAWIGEGKPGFPVGGEATAMRALLAFLEERYPVLGS